MKKWLTPGQFLPSRRPRPGACLGSERAGHVGDNRGPVAGTRLAEKPRRRTPGAVGPFAAIECVFEPAGRLERDPQIQVLLGQVGRRAKGGAVSCHGILESTGAAVVRRPRNKLGECRVAGALVASWALLARARAF